MKKAQPNKRTHVIWYKALKSEDYNSRTFAEGKRELMALIHEKLSEGVTEFKIQDYTEYRTANNF